MNRRQLHSAKARARSSGHAHWYPDYVYNVREDITMRNMDEYDRQQEAVRTRCLEINPDYYSLPWPERWEVWKQARVSLGLREA
jgi:hypothetical protein